MSEILFHQIIFLMKKILKNFLIMNIIVKDIIITHIYQIQKFLMINIIFKKI